MSNKLIQIIDLIEKVLKISVLTLFFLVVATQLILSYQPLNLHISLLDKLEGTKMENNVEYLATDFNTNVDNINFKVITPYITSLPKGKIYVNESEVANFAQLQTTIAVKPNDQITMDFSGYQLNLELKITAGKNTKTIYIKKGKSYTFYYTKPD